VCTFLHPKYIDWPIESKLVEMMGTIIVGDNLHGGYPTINNRNYDTAILCFEDGCEPLYGDPFAHFDSVINGYKKGKKLPSIGLFKIWKIIFDCAKLKFTRVHFQTCHTGSFLKTKRFEKQIIDNQNKFLELGEMEIVVSGFRTGILTTGGSRDNLYIKCGLRTRKHKSNRVLGKICKCCEYVEVIKIKLNSGAATLERIR
jgi:hypothetical protein